MFFSPLNSLSLSTMEISLDRVEGGMLNIVILDIFGADRVLCTTATFLIIYKNWDVLLK